MILLSELSRRRIRSVQKLIRVNRNEVVVVLRVDEEKGIAKNLLGIALSYSCFLQVTLICLNVVSLKKISLDAMTDLRSPRLCIQFFVMSLRSMILPSRNCMKRLDGPCTESSDTPTMPLSLRSRKDTSRHEKKRRMLKPRMW